MGLNVLVVDDSAVMRKMVLRTLEMTGLPLDSVREAADGREALEIIDSNWIDIVLLDLNMPGMDGIELIDRLRAQESTKNLRILVVSTEGSEARLERIRPLISGFVHKPFTPEEIGEKIRAITGVADD